MKEQEKQPTRGASLFDQEVRADGSQARESSEEEISVSKASIKTTTTGLSRFARQRPGRVLITGLLFSVIVLLGAGVFFTWRHLKGPEVSLYQVGAKQSIEVYAGGGGIIYPHQQLDISYPVSVHVLAVYVKAGDHVVPNQALMKLDPSQINAQIAQAANDVAAALAYLNSVSSLNNAIATAQAERAYEQALSRYNTLLAQASSPTLRNGNLVSPMRGVVTAVNIAPDEIFAANTTALTIMDQSTVIVHAKIPLSSLGLVHVDTPATVIPSALPDVHLQGKVISVIPVSDAQTDTFEARVEVANLQQKLLPGMSAFVRVQGKIQGIALPRASVINVGDGAFVFVVRNQHAYVRKVHIVGGVPGQIVVDAGVAPGETIVAVGAYQLQDGQQVNVTGIEH